ncbi:MAG: hypothetical protein A2782_01495 [Candidatus Blackburnbacteria bacterium RIFCSPHIGHO2_01_FULL_43_15b]|uniref:Uncharacterized protein n=1 Tax=Candidatus Blackburnbacteria bacterium RIFCSPHIGHO2_01_FULL_43_15b TaxID=1797513 RepID=A0A1G1UXF2_9BACT|nr:MAG: hypothetical protein A2782_01495 [Candidatus Blackburnbacteria bacterium RIFCSPHIGHO2_01_FULL_43_15b]
MTKRTAVKIFASSIATGSLLAYVVFPTLAQSDATNQGQNVAACNKTAREEGKSVRAGFKEGRMTKDERNTRLKGIEKDRVVCIKNARAAAKEAREKARQELKAKKEASIRKSVGKSGTSSTRP